MHSSSNSRPTIRKSPVVAIAAGLGSFVGLGALVWQSHGLQAWERPIVSAVTHLDVHLRVTELFLRVWQPLPFALMTIALAVAAAMCGRRRVAILGAAGCFAAIALTEIVVKPLVGRHLLGAHTLLFPSGHVTAAGAWAMFAWLVVGRGWLRTALVLIPLAVGGAVIAVHAHYPADALGGIVVGALVVYLVTNTPAPSMRLV